jgi:hypothetical protein
MFLSVFRRRLAVCAVLVGPALTLAGCGGSTISTGSIVALVKKHIRLAGGTPNSVRCPSSISDQVSQTVSCDANVTSASGKVKNIVVQVLLHHSTAEGYTFLPAAGSTGTTTS